MGEENISIDMKNNRKFILPANPADIQVSTQNPNLPVLKANDSRAVS